MRKYERQGCVSVEGQGVGVQAEAELLEQEVEPF